ncbi:MAG: hypothetical protein M3Y54_22210 [Bacteroidota bacterium]|nr:hypothetical protein [Bacteroidota bacterium]
MTKKIVLQAISKLPDNFSLDVMIERLVFIEKVEEGFAQLDRGEWKTHEEVKEMVKAWRR